MKFSQMQVLNVRRQLENFQFSKLIELRSVHALLASRQMPAPSHLPAELAHQSLSAGCELLGRP